MVLFFTAVCVISDSIGGGGRKDSGGEATSSTCPSFQLGMTLVFIGDDDPEKAEDGKSVVVAENTALVPFREGSIIDGGAFKLVTPGTEGKSYFPDVNDKDDRPKSSVAELGGWAILACTAVVVVNGWCCEGCPNKTDADTGAFSITSSEVVSFSTPLLLLSSSTDVTSVEWNSTPLDGTDSVYSLYELLPAEHSCVAGWDDDITSACEIDRGLAAGCEYCTAGSVVLVVAYC